jgi:hypothetical protein
LGGFGDDIAGAFGVGPAALDDDAIGAVSPDEGEGLFGFVFTGVVVDGDFRDEQVAAFGKLRSKRGTNLLLCLQGVLCFSSLADSSSAPRRSCGT